MTRAATLPILALALLLLILLGPAVDAQAIIPETVDVQVAAELKDRAEAREWRAYRRLRQRHLAWR